MPLKTLQKKIKLKNDPLIQEITINYHKQQSCTCTYIVIMEGMLRLRDHPRVILWESGLPKLSHFFSLFQAQEKVILHRIYRKNIPKDNLFSSKLWKIKMVKTSPCFKFVGLSLQL